MPQPQQVNPIEPDVVADDVVSPDLDVNAEDSTAEPPRRSKVRVLQYSRSDLLI